MFRTRTLGIAFYQNTCSKNAFVSLVRPKPKNMYNLKPQGIGLSIPEMNAAFSNNNDSLITTRNGELKFKLSNTLNSRKSSRSENCTYIKYNALPRTSTLLQAKNDYSRNLCTKSFEPRYFSSAPTEQLPTIKLAGIWKRLSESDTVEFIQNTLTSFQSTTGLPWWAVIILTTFLTRSMLTMPLTVYQHYIIAKVQNLQVEMNGIVEKLKQEANIAVTYHKWSEFRARIVYDEAVRREWNQLIVRDNCHPAKGFIVVWTQIPLWICLSVALRNLCSMLPPGHIGAYQIYLDLTTGGFGWVLNLADPDPLYILPICVGVFNLLNIETMALLKVQKDTNLQKYVLYFFRFIAIAMIPITTFVPAGMALYWASSSAFGLGQNLAILSPKVRRLVGIPKTPTERATPYSDLVEKINTKFFNSSN